MRNTQELPQYAKCIYEKLTMNIILNVERLKAFLFRSETRKGCLFSPLFKIVLEVLKQLDPKKRKRNKRHPHRKEKLKLSLFTNDMILYFGNPKESTRKLLELINGFSKVVGYKNPLFLCISNEQSKKGNFKMH